MVWNNLFDHALHQKTNEHVSIYQFTKSSHCQLLVSQISVYSVDI